MKKKNCEELFWNVKLLLLSWKLLFLVLRIASQSSRPSCLTGVVYSPLVISFKKCKNLENLVIFSVSKNVVRMSKPCMELGAWHVHTYSPSCCGDRWEQHVSQAAQQNKTAMEKEKTHTETQRHAATHRDADHRHTHKLLYVGISFLEIT